MGEIFSSFYFSINTFIFFGASNQIKTTDKLCIRAKLLTNHKSARQTTDKDYENYTYIQISKPKDSTEKNKVFNMTQNNPLFT